MPTVKAERRPSTDILKKKKTHINIAIQKDSFCPDMSRSQFPEAY